MLREELRRADDAKVAIGHFNVSELVALQAVTAAARELHAPVLVGVSESERAFIGVRQIEALVRSIRDEYGLPIFLNADHTHSLAKAIEAARAGFDSVVFDASALPFAENASQTKKAVEDLKSINPSIVVEGEIGDIGTGSEIHREAPSSARVLSTVEEAKEFVNSTGVDVLAPAVGNMHGMTGGMAAGKVRKRLDIGRIREIKAATRVFMTLHGGSGTDDDDLRQAIKAGMTVVHVNTELRIAWRHGVEEGLARDPVEIAPYKILPAALERMRQVVLSRLELFRN
jgi:fructose-bisphosphate aldolase class II